MTARVPQLCDGRTMEYAKGPNASGNDLYAFRLAASLFGAFPFANYVIAVIAELLDMQKSPVPADHGVNRKHHVPPVVWPRDVGLGLGPLHRAMHMPGKMERIVTPEEGVWGS